MSAFTNLLTLPNVVAACMMLALNAYVLFGGADFGGGVWDFFASGPRKQQQRDLIAHTIGPIWEANHVWLILVVVLLFVCFPPAFATLMTVLHIPLSVMLIGIVLRGSAFTFRAYDTSSDRVQQRWGRIFAIASVITPLWLGVCVGTIASGRITAIATTMRPYDIYIAPWLSPFPLACGVLTLALFALLAAVYLTVETGDAELHDDFRRRALWAAGAVFVAAFGTLLVAHTAAPIVREGLTGSAWALPLQLATAVAALATIWALWTRRYRIARLAAPAQVSLILWGWVASQYPYMIPGVATITDSAAPSITLRLTLWGLLGGGVVLAPSLWYLFKVFTGEPRRYIGNDA